MPQIAQNWKLFYVWIAEEKKIWAIFQRIIELIMQKIVITPQKYGFGIRDPRSGIRKKPIPDPGSRGQKGTGSRIQIRNTEYRYIYPWELAPFAWLLVAAATGRLATSRTPTFPEYMDLLAQNKSE